VGADRPLGRLGRPHVAGDGLDRQEPPQIAPDGGAAPPRASAEHSHHRRCLLRPLSAMLMGLPEFARLLLAHAPREALEPETLRVLQETAEGRLPSAWKQA